MERAFNQITLTKMKAIFYSISLVFLFIGCTQNSNQKRSSENFETTKQEKVLILKTMLDNFFSENKDCLNNDLTLKGCAKSLQSDFIQNYLGDSIPCISELPLKFERLMEYNADKYVVKFGYGETTNKAKISNDYEVTFQVFSIVDKSTALTLKEGSLYNIYGSCHDFANQKSFTLPSGRYFEDYPKLLKMDGKPYLILGTLIVKNIEFELTK